MEVGAGVGVGVGVGVDSGVFSGVGVGVGAGVGVGSGVVFGPAQPRRIAVSSVKAIAMVNSFDFLIALIYQG